MTKNDLFLQLARSGANGRSKWIKVTEFVGQYADLSFANGASWKKRNLL